MADSCIVFALQWTYVQKLIFSKFSHTFFGYFFFCFLHVFLQKRSCMILVMQFYCHVQNFHLSGGRCTAWKWPKGIEWNQKLSWLYVYVVLNVCIWTSLCLQYGSFSHCFFMFNALNSGLFCSFFSWSLLTWGLVICVFQCLISSCYHLVV